MGLFHAVMRVRQRVYASHVSVADLFAGPLPPLESQVRLLIAALGRDAVPDTARYARAYLSLPTEFHPYWPVIAHWADYADTMGEGRRRRYFENDLVAEFRVYLHVARVPWCQEIQQMLVDGQPFVPLDYVHITRCDHCKWFVPRWNREHSPARTIARAG